MDKRTEHQKWLWEKFGPPLYYCSGCLLEVDVKSNNGEITIKRPCDCGDCEVIAPRRAIAIGKGGASINTRAKILFYKLLAAMTGRCV